MHVSKKINAAISELKKGRMIILCDDPSRENEADLIAVAETISTEQMNFMIRNGAGIVCLSMTRSRLQELDLPLMVAHEKNSSACQTPFTISIDAAHGITTGVSAADRAHTVRTAIANQAKPADLARPGHVFPLLAQDDGVFARAGHTEGSVDLVKLAGFQPAAVICELMNADGSMMHGEDLTAFAKKHQLLIVTMDELRTYRYATEDLIADTANTTLPLEHYGQFNLQIVKEKLTHAEHMVLYKENLTSNLPLIRIHSACATGDLFTSKRCDCHNELHYSLKRISEEGGMLIYLNQEGRGIGLLNKIKAYELQDQGFDTVDANLNLGLPADSRNYHLAANILRRHNIQRLRLLTNNPEKINDLNKYGICEVLQEAMPVFHNEFNHQYLMTKKEKLNHTITWSNL